MANISIPDHTLACLQMAADARQISLEALLEELAAMKTIERQNSKTDKTQFKKSDVARRAAAADSIRKLAAEVKGKSTIEELIADKHAGHKY